MTETPEERILQNRFAIKTRLGAGGMATVWRGEDLFTRKPVAIKILGTTSFSSAGGDRELMALRFKREADLLCRLQGLPQVVQFIGSGETPEGDPYLVMELVEGRPLRRLMSRAVGELSVGAGLEIAEQLTSCLRGIHARHVLHRDLSPDNVMITKEKGSGTRIKLLDFGIGKSLEPEAAKLTRENTLLGRPAYFSPEAAAGEPLSVASDVYSFGVILYELVTGRLPIEVTSMAEAVRIRRDPPRPMIAFPGSQRFPEEFRAIVMECLEKDPGRRPTLEAIHECVHELLRRSHLGEDLSAVFSMWELTQSISNGAPSGKLLAADQVFGPFEVRAWLGSGPRGEVWSCRDRRTGRDVAVKVFHGEESTVRGLLEGRRKAAQVEHPKIVPIHDIDHVDHRGYVASDQLRGQTLAGVIEDCGSIPANRWLQVAQDVFAALEHAHAAGVVHGAIHARNVVVDEFDNAHLTDLGSAPAPSATDPFESDARWVLGLAPECVLGADPTVASDVYALGSLLYQMSTGRAPFDGKVLQVMYRHVNARPDHPRWLPEGLLPRGLVNLILWCLEKDPANRPANVSEVRAAVDRAFGSPDDADVVKAPQHRRRPVPVDGR